MGINVFKSLHLLKTPLRNAAPRIGAVIVLASVALLSAPFVNSPRPERDFIPSPQPAKPQSRIAVTFRSGETLLHVLKRFGVEAPSAQDLIEKVRPLVNLRKIRSGNDVQVVLGDGDKTVEAMEFVVEGDLIRVKATDEGWFAERRRLPFVSRVVKGTIKNSLYESGVDAGLSAQQIMDLAKIFESRIDFFSDVHAGDDFSVVVEDLSFPDGRHLGGRVLAAELQTENGTFDAFYFDDEGGSGAYYNINGESLHRSFLRAPLSYSRISSPFSFNRMHPIFRSIHPHLAIDYAAPTGTPVVAIGSGRVDFVGWRSGYGNVVDIRHAENYASRYAHFSRFAPNLHVGQSVAAGEVIGYVGQTGDATGPHLHFEFLHGGTKINFLTFQSPITQQLSGQELARFNRLRDQHLAMLRRREPVTRTAQGSL